jgi:hypothetical protein
LRFLCSSPHPNTTHTTLSHTHNTHMSSKPVEFIIDALQTASFDKQLTYWERLASVKCSPTDIPDLIESLIPLAIKCLAQQQQQHTAVIAPCIRALIHITKTSFWELRQLEHLLESIAPFVCSSTTDAITRLGWVGLGLIECITCVAIEHLPHVLDRSLQRC